MNIIQRWKAKRRERSALLRIVSIMQSEEQMVIDDLCRQVEQRLHAMPPEEALKAIQILKGETS